MSNGPRLDLRQTQSLVMTPQLQQAIKMLQLNNVELSELVERELEQNPLLEKAEQQDTPEIEDIVQPKNQADSQTVPDHQKDIAPTDEETMGGNDLDTDFENVWTGHSVADRQAVSPSPSDYDPGSAMAGLGSGGGLNFDSPDFNIENTLSDSQTLRDHLYNQVVLEFAGEQERLIAGALIDQLDESGYLQADPAQIADQLGTEEDRVSEILTKLQGFDPSGIFARSLGECLAIQLRERDRLDPAMQVMLDHLDILGNHDFRGLARICGVSEDDITEMVAEIRSLNPKPALEFEHFVTQTVIPDVVMRKLPPSQGGGWGVELNSDTLPRVLVNRRYYAEVRKTARDKTEIQYLRDRMTAANWLVKALDMRAQTILKVASEIIRQQEAFFLYGVEFLRPLVLRDIAEVIDMHESTISRVTTNKYIGTPRGIFELKYFFTSAIPGTGGADSHSAEAVKAKIKNLIDAENPQKILSDDAIVEALKKDGIDIARRTVAKYREAMHIPSSVQRRRQKKNLA